MLTLLWLPRYSLPFAMFLQAKYTGEILDMFVPLRNYFLPSCKLMFIICTIFASCAEMYWVAFSSVLICVMYVLWRKKIRKQSIYPDSPTWSWATKEKKDVYLYEKFSDFTWCMYVLAWTVDELYRFCIPCDTKEPKTDQTWESFPVDLFVLISVLCNNRGFKPCWWLHAARARFREWKGSHEAYLSTRACGTALGTDAVQVNCLTWPWGALDVKRTRECFDAVRYGWI